MCWLVLISRIVFGQYNMVIYSYPEHKLQIGLQCCFSFGEGYMWSVYGSCPHVWCSLWCVIVYISVCLHGNELPCFCLLIRKMFTLVNEFCQQWEWVWVYCDCIYLTTVNFGFVMIQNARYLYECVHLAYYFLPSCLVDDYRWVSEQKFCFCISILLLLF